MLLAPPHTGGGPRTGDRDSVIVVNISDLDCTVYKMHDLCCLFMYPIHVTFSILYILSFLMLLYQTQTGYHPGDTVETLGPLLETWRQYHATWRPSECRVQTHAEYLQKQGQSCVELSTDLREVSQTAHYDLC